MKYKRTAKGSKGELMKKVNKKMVVGIVLMVLLVGVMLIAYQTFREKLVDGVKTITIEVVDDKGQIVSYKLKKTTAKVLIEAMNEAKEQGLTFAGTEGPYGLSLHTVNGLYADYTETGTFWYVYVNGKECDYGISTQPIEDGDVFQIKLELASAWQ